ncbi:MAG: hypothetical protein IPL61_22235 [Myxococcales bacterium]|nr:hypothetical protein [Myxococcales bacterium]
MAVCRPGTIAIAVVGACAAPPAAPSGVPVTVVDGYDWSLPPGLGPVRAGGFYGDQLAPELGVDVRVLDLTWRQLEPTEGALRRDTYGQAQGLDFSSWDDQRADGGRYWLRLWLTGVDWAPAWLPAACGVAPIPGVDDDGQAHLPLWDPCVWGKARALYARVLGDAGVAADPDLVLAYVPGGFTWSDFDFGPIERAVDAGLAPEVVAAWTRTMAADLAAIAGADVGKLTYTGEDYPSERLGAVDDLLAAGVVAAGLGVRSARTELANYHLAAAPAWGARIAADGHVVVDAAATAGRVRAVEHECYDACGFAVADRDELEYAIRTSNWKALALGAQWMYVAPVDSHLEDYAGHWRWVRAELGRTAADAFDGWVVLREAEDRAWADDATVTWARRPWVVNLERFVVQREVAPDGVSARGTELRRGVLDARDGTAYEGRRTTAATGGRALYFAVDRRWLAGDRAVEVQVTFLDDGCGGWTLRYATAAGVGEAPVVACGDTGVVRTARIRLPRARFAGLLPGATDLAVVRAGDADVEVRYLRVVRE